MSARDVLRERVARVLYESTDPIIPWEKILDGDLRTYRFLADKVLDALRAHPVELLALLAEPKVCETCGGTGSKKPVENPLAFPCDACHGSGSVAVDVLDLLVQAGLVEVLDKTATRVNDNEWRHYTVRHDATVYVAKDGTP